MPLHARVRALFSMDGDKIAAKHFFSKSLQLKQIKQDIKPIVTVYLLASATSNLQLARLEWNKHCAVISCLAVQYVNLSELASSGF